MSKNDMQERDYLFDWYKSVEEYYYISAKLEHNYLAQSNFPNIWANLNKKNHLYFIATRSIYMKLANKSYMVYWHFKIQLVNPLVKLFLNTVPHGHFGHKTKILRGNCLWSCGKGSFTNYVDKKRWVGSTNVLTFCQRL